MAFNNGIASRLILNRNTNLGVMFASERNVFYVQIILRMSYFRREHEIEPLNDEIYLAVKTAQESYSGEEYTSDFFNRDIQQLFDWNIISRRIEKERLRGYKDIRRQKFRFGLTEETVSFINWLEECYHNDIEEKVVDSRNFLIDLTGRLKETVRSLQRIAKNEYSDNEARIQEAANIIYSISLLDELTFKISTQLGELNARLLSFLFTNYNLQEAKNAISELEFYTSSYLKQVDKLRREIIEHIKKITDNKNLSGKLDLCSEMAAEYYAKLPFIAKKKILKQSIVKTFELLENFYKTSGKLDQLCRRINDTAMKVWNKLSAYLRELERKNTRLEDIRSIINEMSGMDEENSMDDFFFELLSLPQMVTDTNYWKDGFEKADPPLPRLINEKKIREPRYFYKIRNKADGKPVQSLQQFKLEKLKQWVDEKYIENEDNKNLISKWNFDSYEDFSRIIELAENGILSDGKKLDKIDMGIEVQEETVEVVLKRAQLQFRDMLLKKKESNVY